ncbi:arabinose operon transcriptional regulator AraC [Erwiniaceae bacterium BAC15a-03b]|uniref:Arabinose operon regulatory protein n=1 Tax=Winslowiella arboricola TaxID=2978220 RepID=A0A9J6PDU9_9GAMM|nr:arabinose operon transcriptional regulator AraC [Winslowiella arboricola]MCU5771628.1 arabinose operon transcriptional regulator AraC [Winslowiella arboricola]MCU5776441.1 arabinose operon transcriptional regulator AraC [Winslowiella arboricola]
MAQLEEAGILNFTPLFRRFTFNAWMVAGFTPISRGSKLDFYINRASGMKGHILNLTLRGQGKIYTPKGSFICQPGELLHFPAGVPHYYGRDEQSEFWDHLWIYFIPRTYWLEWLQWNQSVETIGRLALSSASGLEQMQARFMEVIQLSFSDEPLAEALAMNAVERVILECYRAQPDLHPSRIDPRIARLCQFLNEHMAEETTVEQLSRRACLSPSRLAHLFKEETGQTIFAWREKQRIARACELLQKTSFAITHVALTVGYNDPLYFSRLFRNHMGISPRTYRKKYEI